MRAIDMKENQDFIMQVLQHSPTDFDEALKMIDTVNTYIARCTNYDNVIININRQIACETSDLIFFTETVKILKDFKESEEAKLLMQLCSQKTTTDNDLQKLQSKFDKCNAYGIKITYPRKTLCKGFSIYGHARESRVWFDFDDFNIDEKIKSYIEHTNTIKETITTLKTQKTEIEKAGVSTPYFWDAEYHEIYLSNQGV